MSTMGLKAALAAGLAALLMAAPASAQTIYSGVAYRSTQGDYIGQGEVHSYTAPPGVFAVNRLALNNELQFLFDTGPDPLAPGWTWWDLRVAAANGAVLMPGTFTGARRFASATEPGLDFGGDGRGCNQVFGQFTVHEATYDPNDGSVLSFSVDFEQHCEQASAPVLYGELRYNSTRAFTGGGGGGGGGGSGGPRVTNLSTRGMVLQGDDVMISGFVISGPTNKTVAITATGPSLAAYGVTNPLGDPHLTLVRQSDGVVVATNDSWQAAPNRLAMEWTGYAPKQINEAAILISLAPGAYTAIVSGSGGTTGVAVVAVYELAQADVPLINLSTRGQVRAGTEVMISGFVVAPGAPKTVAIVGAGPSLAAFGVTAPLSNPTLTLVRSSDQSVVATNDDWVSAPYAAQLGGLAPADALESAILVTLDPGAYTAVLSGVGGATGMGLIAVYAVP